MRVRALVLPPRSALALAAASLLGWATIASAQDTAPSSPPAGRPAPPPPQNLQFFPKDTSRQDLIQTMRQFAFALGVRCDHCHVDEESGPNPREDFASDEKPAKVKARAMLQMTKQLNEQLLTKVPNRSQPAVSVSCVTCHHGLPVPQTLTAHLRAQVDKSGADAAVAELKRLRDEAEFGRFDVSEWSVNEAARALSTDGKHDEALALLRANAGFHPESNAILAMMAEIHVARGDKPAAIEILRKLVATDPENRRAKRMLEQLEGATPDGKR